MPKTNKYAFVVFVDPDEDAYEVKAHLIDWLTSRHYCAAISPLHDKDVWTAEDVESWIRSQVRLYAGGYQGEQYFSLIDWNADTYQRPKRRAYDKEERRFIEIAAEEVKIPHVGDLKKPHYHVYIKLDYSTTAVAMIQKFSELHVTYFEEVNSERGYLRYLAHLDNPEKARYSVIDCVSLGGVDISPLYSTSEAEKRELYGAIFKLINDYKPYNVFQLVELVKEDYKMLCEVKGL